MPEKEQVIVRAYGDEPVCLKALSLRDGRVEVAKEDESKSISLPQSFVYRFTPDLFKRLREAYQSDDKSELKQYWRSAEVYVWGNR